MDSYKIVLLNIKGNEYVQHSKNNYFTNDDDLPAKENDPVSYVIYLKAYGVPLQIAKGKCRVMKVL